MMGHLSSDERRLLALAEAQHIADPDVRGSWPAILAAIESGWLLPGDGPYSIPATIDKLERTGLVSIEEYALQPDDDDPDVLRVTLISKTHKVPRAKFLEELERLDDDFRAGRGPSESNPPPPPAELPDPRMLRQAFQELLGATGQTPDTPESERVRREAAAELDRLAATGDEDVASSLDGLSEPDRAQMADALRAFATWTEKPEGHGEAVDEVIRGLEDTIGRLLPGRRAELRETDARIRESAQDAIARRLRGDT